MNKEGKWDERSIQKCNYLSANITMLVLIPTKQNVKFPTRGIDR